MNIVLRHALNTAIIHKERIEAALRKIEHFFPISPEVIVDLQLENLGYFELYTNRLAKLQDLMGAKIFTEILEEMEDEGEVSKMSFIDKLNKLEKLEIIESAEEWKAMREIRNHISHEYPDMPDVTAKHLNEMHNIAPKLLSYLERIIIFTEERL